MQVLVDVLPSRVVGAAERLVVAQKDGVPIFGEASRRSRKRHRGPSTRKSMNADARGLGPWPETTTSTRDEGCFECLASARKPIKSILAAAAASKTSCRCFLSTVARCPTPSSLRGGDGMFSARGAGIQGATPAVWQHPSRMPYSAPQGETTCRSPYALTGSPSRVGGSSARATRPQRMVQLLFPASDEAGDIWLNEALLARRGPPPSSIARRRPARVRKPNTPLRTLCATSSARFKRGTDSDSRPLHRVHATSPPSALSNVGAVPDPTCSRREKRAQNPSSQRSPQRSSCRRIATTRARPLRSARASRVPRVAC